MESRWSVSTAAVARVSAPGRIRTCDAGLRRAALYPLSYEGAARWRCAGSYRVAVPVDSRADGGGIVIASALMTLVVALAAVWVAGSAIAPRAPAAERLGFGVLAALGLAWATMLQGPAGIGLLGSPWALRLLALVLLAALVAVRRPPLRPQRIAPIPVACAVVTTALVTYPGALRTTPLLWPSHSDMLWHQGWIRELAAGASAPGGVYAGEPNSYPWLYHSIAAWLLGALPGDLNAALLALAVGGVAAGWLGMWLAARELGAGTAAATWSAGLFTAAAGFGWVWQHAPAALLHQNGRNLGPYHGDLVMFNVFIPALGNVPPLIPRELSVCIAPFAVWLLVRGLRDGPAAVLWAAGAATGFAFLIGPVAGGFCIAWAIGMAAVRRTPAVWRTLAAAAVVAAVWLVPLGLAYGRYGGFVSITHITAVNPTLPQTVVALGVLLPLGVAGTAAIAARPDGIARAEVLLLWALPAAACAIGAVLGHRSDLLGTPALLRWSRYLPFVALGLAIPGGVAAERAVAWARRGGAGAAAAAAAVLVALAVPSTVLATVAVERRAFPDQLTCTQLPGAHDLTAVGMRQPLADEVAMDVFARTGAPAVFLRIVHSKVRYRTWLRRPPTQQQRKAWSRDLLLRGIVPPGAAWVVWSRSAAPLRGSVLHPAGTCRLRGRVYRVYRR
jgi:hypothetical protein